MKFYLEKAKKLQNRIDRLTGKLPIDEDTGYQGPKVASHGQES